MTEEFQQSRQLPERHRRPPEDDEEFDALRFLENFIQQHRTSTSHDHLYRPDDTTTEGASQPRNTPITSQPRTGNALPVQPSTLPRGYRYRVEPLREEPPPRYEDVSYIHGPPVETTSAGIPPSELPPRYDEVRHIIQTDRDNANDYGEGLDGFSTESDSFVRQDNIGSSMWNRDDDRRNTDRLPMSEFTGMTTNVGERERDTATVERPQNWLCRAVFVTIFCFWPMGIFAIWQAKKANAAARRGDYMQGHFNAGLARILTNGALLFGMCMYAGLIGGFFGRDITGEPSKVTIIKDRN